MQERDGKWNLIFDLRGTDLSNDGFGNPYWRKAADFYEVVGGDLGRLGRTPVAVFEVDGDTGEHRGRDGQGRAVRMVPVDDEAKGGEPCEACEAGDRIGGHSRACVLGQFESEHAPGYEPTGDASEVDARRADGSPDASGIVAKAIREGWSPSEHPVWPVPGDTRTAEERERDHRRAVARTRIVEEAKAKGEAARAARLAEKHAVMFGGTYGTTGGAR
jgi:hypothetical protein